MKAILFFLFFAAVGIGIYFLFHKQENFKVKDHIVVSQQSGMDINAPTIAAPQKYGVIEGNIQNISRKNFKDVIIVYQSGADTVKAVVGNLEAGGKSEFKTNSMEVRTNRPDYALVDILFSEEE
jgi:hypothetical protein